MIRSKLAGLPVASLLAAGRVVYQIRSEVVMSQRLRVMVVGVVLVVGLVGQTLPAQAFVPSPACPPTLCGAALIAAGNAVAGAGAAVGTVGTGLAVAGGLLVWGAYELTSWFWDQQPPPTGLNQRYVVTVSNSGIGSGAMASPAGGYQSDSVGANMGYPWETRFQSHAGGGFATLGEAQACAAGGACRNFMGSDPQNITLNIPYYGAQASPPITGVQRYAYLAARATDGSGVVTAAAVLMVLDLVAEPDRSLFLNAECTDSVGAKSIVSSELPTGGSGLDANPKPGGSVVCPAGTRLTGLDAGVGMSGTGLGVDPVVRTQVQTQFPDGSDAAAVAAAEMAYPECTRGAGCTLDLRYVDPATGTVVVCVDGDPQCTGWPNEVADPAIEMQCQWGGYVLPGGQCINLEFDPATTQTTQATPDTVADPYNPPNPQPTQAPDPQPDPQPDPNADPVTQPTPVTDPTPAPEPEVIVYPYDCEGDDGPLGFLNFIQGAKCAMQTTFQPKQATVERLTAARSSLSSKAPFSTVAGASAWLVPLRDLNSGGCPNWSPIIAGESVETVCAPWFTAAMRSVRGLLLGALIVAFAAPLVWSFWRGSVPVIKPQ